MACSDSTYLGFGFGAIQAGLFLLEAQESGAFDRLVVAEVVPEMVRALRKNEGAYAVNIPRAGALQVARVSPVEMLDPGIESDRQLLVAAVAEAREIGTALPSVDFYTSPAPGSVHRILAEGLRKKAACDGPCAVVYAAENNNHAATILEQEIMTEVPAAEREAVDAKVRFLDTVIGKMSGVVTDAQEISERRLAAIVPGMDRAFLVEAFNHILVSKPDFGASTAFQRGIAVFEEKDALLPFEEAKLYGHNATHALAAYMGALLGVECIAELQQMEDVMLFLRDAFIEESGVALCRKHGGIDPLFTKKGYTAYVDDLLERMMDPLLGDTVERVGRDPQRKLAWDDRLIGTMRVALAQGIEPRRYAMGAAAALIMLEPDLMHDERCIDGVIKSLWQDASPDDAQREAVVHHLGWALKSLRESPRIRDTLGM
jgi:mannitol-1-phosphate 5-dehydrogenase